MSPEACPPPPAPPQMPVWDQLARTGPPALPPRRARRPLALRLVPAAGVLRHRHYRLLWSANVLSSVGNWMQNAAYGVLVLHITGSPFWTTFVPAAQQLVMGPLGAAGGQLADRYNRRNLLAMAQCVFALTTAALGAAVLAGHASLGLFLGVAAVNGVFLSVSFPAYQALFPRLIPAEEIYSAVAINSVAFNLARIAGPALGAVVLRVWGAGQVFLVNAATFAVFAAALGRIPAAAGRISEPRRAEGASMAEAFRFARRHPAVGTPLLAIGAISAFGLPVIWLAPLVAERVFGRADHNGFLLSALGAGAVVGALAAASVPQRRKAAAGVLSYLVFGASLAAFAFVTQPAASLALVAVAGAGYMGAAVVIQSVVQLATPDRLRGRVMSLYMMAWLGLLPVGGVLAGAVAQAVGRQWGAPVALAAGAAVCLAVAVRLGLRRDWVPR